MTIPKGWVPPDGGYGWVILACCTGINTLAAQSFADFGIFFIELVDYFDASEVLVAWIGACQLAMSGFSALVWAAILERYGSRIVMASGSSLIIVTYIISTFVQDVRLLLLTYGILPGIGFGALLLVSSVHVQMYFDKRRSLAVGITVAGLSVGGFMWPPFSAWLIETFSWRGAMLIQSSFHLNGFVAVGLLRPPEVCKSPRKQKPNAATGTDDNLNPVQSSGDTQKQNHTDQPEENGIELNQLPETQLLPPKTEITEDETVESQLLQTNINKEISDIPQDGQTQCEEYKQTDNGSIVIEESSTMLEKVDKGKESKKKKWMCLEMLSMLKEPTFLLFCAGHFFVQEGALASFVFLPVRGVSLGVDRETASFLISIGAALNCGGRIIFGFVGDRFPNRRLVLYATAASCCGILTLIQTTFENFTLVAVYCALWGTVGACSSALYRTIPMDLLGREHLAKGVGTLLLFTGLAYLVSYPLCGFMLQKFQDTRYPFLMLGSFQLTGGMLCFILQIILHCSKKRAILEARNAKPIYIGNKV